MNLRRLWIAACVAWLLLLPAMTAWAVPGTVRLKNGGWIEGEIVTLLPGESVTVRGADGTTKKVSWTEVERVDQAPTAAPAPAAPAAAPATATPATPTPATAAAPAAEATEPAEVATAPAAPAPQRTVLSLNDPNTHRVLLLADDTKIYFLSLPRSDASSVALRFERYVREAELAECKEVLVTIDGVATSYPLQHKLVRDPTGQLEIVQAQAKIELIEQMANAKSVKFDLCEKSRPLSFAAHNARIVRYAKQFKELVGKPVLAHRPAGDFEAAPSNVGYSSESLIDLERRRSEISLGGPIALTAGGGALGVTGIVLLIYGVIIDQTQDDLCDDVDPVFGPADCDYGVDTTPFYVGGLGGIVLGGIGLGIGIPKLSSAIRERRELGHRIREIRRRDHTVVHLEW